MPEIRMERDGATALITIDHPAKLNAVTLAMAAQLTAVFEEFDADPALRVAVVTGEGSNAFSTGAYINEYLEAGTVGEGTTGPRATFIPPWGIWKPLIAAINGYCIGGGFGLALSCDLRIAGRDAQIGPSGLRRGVYQGGTQTQRLIRLISFPRALEMLLLSQYVSGEEAFDMGLVNRVEEPGDVLPRAMDIAHTIAGFDPDAVRMTKKLAYRGLHMDWEAAFEFDLDALNESMRTASAQEGFGAFTEKRQARFTSGGEQESA